MHLWYLKENYLFFFMQYLSVLSCVLIFQAVDHWYNKKHASLHNLTHSKFTKTFCDYVTYYSTPEIQYMENVNIV